MSYSKQHSRKVKASIVGLFVLAAIAMWQFYLFAAFRDAQGLLDRNGGIGHLWWAISLTVVACIGGFFVFSAFVTRDSSDELHITS